MKNNKSFPLRYILLSLFFFSSIYAQDPISVIRKVADKIIAETSFQLYPKLQESDDRVQIINLPNITSGKIIYAKSSIISDEKSNYTFGISSKTPIKIWIYDVLIFQSDKPLLGFSTVAYDMYEFNSTFQVVLMKGKNKVLIKTVTDKDGYFALAAVDKHGMIKENIKFDLPYFSDQDHNWAFLGPLDQYSEDNVSLSYPPEDTLTQHYTINDKIYSWYFPTDNIILDDVIKDEFSFTKHSYFEWHYANGQMLLGMLALADLTGENKYENHIKRFCQFTLDNFDYFKYQYEILNERGGFNHRLFRRIMLDDTGAPALPFIELFSRGQLIKVEFLIDLIADYVHEEQIRLPDGTLARPEPKEYTVWADDLFMSVPFLLRYAKLTGQDQYYDDAANQILLFYEKLFDSEINLYYHGWFSDTKENSVAHWGRANGWVIWAISEALVYLPKEHKHYKEILEIYKKHVNGLVNYQDESGIWHQVIDKPESFEETSSSAMFTLGIARGVLNGWLNKSFKEYAVKGWDAISEKIEGDGTVLGICRGTGIGFDLQFYYDRETPDNDPRGLGAVLTAGVEVSKLLNESE